jgi:hypothetical protein
MREYKKALPAVRHATSAAPQHHYVTLPMLHTEQPDYGLFLSRNVQLRYKGHYVLLMKLCQTGLLHLTHKRQFAITRTRRPTGIPTLLRQLAYNHAFCHILCPQKLLVFISSQHLNIRKCRSAGNLSGYFSVFWKTVCRWVTTTCCFANDVILAIPRRGELWEIWCPSWIRHSECTIWSH